MAPIEIFRQSQELDVLDWRLCDFKTLENAVSKVCRQRGILSTNDTVDDETFERHIVHAVGKTPRDAIAVVLIGFDGSAINRSGWIHMNERRHKFIAPQDIFDEVKLEIERIREAAKFSTVSPSQT